MASRGRPGPYRLPWPAPGAWLEDDVLDEQQFIKPWMVESANDHYALDTRRARELLGWSPQHALRETLPRMIEGLNADPDDWYRANKLNPAHIALLGLEPPRG